MKVEVTGYMAVKIVPGINDLETWCTQNGKEVLLDEWDYENNSCLPNTKSIGSHYKAAWKCKKCGYQWRAEIKSRTLLNAGCRKCGFERTRMAQSQPQEGADVESFCKDNGIEWLLSEWGNEENGLQPNRVSRSSSKHKIVWKCNKCGHSWSRTPNERIRVLPDGQIRVTECPMCLKEKHTSFPEQAIYYYVSQGFEDTLNGDTAEIGMELDIYIPSLSVAIEYDGYAWHQDIKTDIRKNNLCKSSGIRIIRIRELGCPELETDDTCTLIDILANNRDDLARVISVLCEMLGYNPNIDLNRDEPLIMALYQQQKYENSIEYLYPELVKEFHKEKNGTLSPKDINKRSSRKVWWQCSVCGYDWLAAVHSRTKGSGCPACSVRALVPGKNDLETWCKETGNEQFLEEWDYKKNPISPSEITKKNSYDALWKCGRCGSSYKAKVYNRSNGNGCPVCSGKKVQRGNNDFETWCLQNGKESILNEWAADNELMPSQVSYGSGKRIAWVCSTCGHRWTATLDNRKKGKGCPECGKIKRAESNRLHAMKSKK